MSDKLDSLIIRHKRLVAQYNLWEAKQASPIRTSVLDIIQDSLGEIEAMMMMERNQLQQREVN